MATSISRARTSTGLLALALLACSSGDPGEPVELSELVTRVPDQMQPKVCTEANSGKRFSTDGYLHWPKDGNLGSSGSDATFILQLYADNDADGAGVGEYATLLAKGRGLLGLMGIVDEPIMHDATEESVIGGTEVTGTVKDEELAVHLDGGGTANGDTPVNVTVELLYLNGGCSLQLVGARAR